MARHDRSYDPYDHLHDDDDRGDRRASAGGLPIRAVELAMRNPLTTAVGALSVVMIGIIAGNAVANQPARHPSPWFTTRAPVEAVPLKVGPAATGTTTPAGAVPTAMPRPRPVSLFDQPQQIQELQAALRDHGFYSGPVDGVLGPATTEAVKACERRLGVTQTGEPNELLLAALRNMPGVDNVATGSLPPAVIPAPTRTQAPARAVAAPAAAPRPAAPQAHPAAQALAQPAAYAVPAQDQRYAMAEGVGYPVGVEPAVESEPMVSSGAVRRAAREPLAQGGNERHQQIQRALVAAGYGPLKADGKWDGKTEAAVKRWEYDHGQAQTGKPSQTLVYGLMVEPTRVRR
jgi:peptidoglycan hydrolase-like protein with peptidoglycan-binding domain